MRFLLALTGAAIGLLLAMGAVEAQPSPGEVPPASVPPASPAPSPAPAAPPSAPPTPPPTEPGTPATVLSPEESEGIIGKSVRSASGEDMGRIVDIIVTTGTQPRAAIIDFGGFLGVGSRKIAVDWRLLQYSRSGKTWMVTVALNRSQLRVSPEYKPGEPVVVLGMPSPPTPAPTASAAPVPASPSGNGSASPPAAATPPSPAAATPAGPSEPDRPPQ